MTKFAVVSRVHNWGQIDQRKVKRFIEAARELDVQVLLACPTDEKSEISVFVASMSERVELIGVEPWGISNSINSLTAAAIERGYERMIIASIEFPPTMERVENLSRFMTSGVFMVGAAFSDHDFKADDVERLTVSNPNALQFPWNTFALIDTAHLVATGVPPIADSPLHPENAGMEEMMTAALQECVFGRTTCLVKLPEGKLDWDRSGWSDVKLQRHSQKIDSKISRSQHQLQLTGLRPSEYCVHINAALPA